METYNKMKPYRIKNYIQFCDQMWNSGNVQLPMIFLISLAVDVIWGSKEYMDREKKFKCTGLIKPDDYKEYK